VSAETRFKPTRAGIINLWDYLDEEFVFADGRLALRGHNGSGKTKALEVLFPFVLDGSLDARRLDPFSGENRTMKANLLYRGQDAEHGYVWMEFARSGEIVTLVIGLVVQKNRDRPKPSFYVTDKRVGVDFGLLTADSRPLTAKQLTALLGRDAYYGERKGAYQDAVDSRLFGLGRERYTQLLDLLIALRRPLLAKDLDPAKVSDTLTAGLSPVDEELVEQAARDFENLAAVQKQYDDLAAADAAVRAFLDHYVAYLRAHTRHQLDQVGARITAAASHVSAITAAAREVSRAQRAEQRADADAKAAGTAVTTLDGRLFALRNLDAYKDHEKLALRRTQLEKDRRALADEEGRLGKARREVTGLEREADQVADKLAEIGRAADRHGRALVEAAEFAGITRDGEPADTGADLAITAKARVARRKDDISEIRAVLTLVRDAERDRSAADSAFGAAQQALARQQESCAAAEQKLAAKRADVTGELRSWADRWGGEEPTVVDQLTDAIESIGEPDAPTLTEVFTALTKDRATALIQLCEQLRGQDAVLAADESGKADQRAEIEAEHDDAPGESDLRPADRTERLGAPLWQLVNFADPVEDHTAAALEGALYGAGLLTAWIHPDQQQTQAALAGVEADGYLVPLAAGERPGGRTLADLLVPEQQDLVDPARVAEVLASIAVADDLVFEPGVAVPVVTTRAQFSYGPLLGGRPKSAPEFIGATNRANRRRARLAELDQQLAAIGRQRAEVAARLGRAGEALADLDQARAELPKTAPVAEAIKEVARAAVLLAAAREQVAGARVNLDKAIADLDARNRRLRHAGADRDMPTSADVVDAVDRAVSDFERAAGELIRARGDVARLDEDLTTRRERIARLDGENDDAAEVLAQRQAEHAAESEKLSVDERVSGAEYEQIRDEIIDVDRDLRAARAWLREAESRVRDEHDHLVRARSDLGHGRDSLAGAVTELTGQAFAFAPYAHGDLRPLLDVQVAAPWPASALWPSAEVAAGQLADRLAVADGPVEPVGAIRAMLPLDAVAILDAFTAATRGGRVVTEGVLKGTTDRMWSAYREFETALKAGEDGYQADLTGDAPFIVEVVTNEGRVSAGAFARKIAEDVEHQGVLLEERERTVLEDSLLTALAQQIHSRVLAAKDLVDEMDADTRSKPMSSGMAIGIRWVRSDKLTDQQGAVSRLLARDAASLGTDGLAELRGLLRAMIHDHRAGNPRDTYREVLGSVLDYRSWHAFELRMISPGGVVERLTRKKHSEMSGGEKSATIHMPLFAAANALYLSAKPTCPRLVALDEAFAGIDDKFKPELLGLTVRFDLDLFMTGHDLWVTFATVPAIAHYDLEHDKAGHTLSAFLAVWDGAQLIDAEAGYAGNDQLATELLGFRPHRYVPADADNVLTMPAVTDDDDEADEDLE
jgi:Putative exonuclease SbcCD, C subunit